jgi:predicted transcriptional regulator
VARGRREKLNLEMLKQMFYELAKRDVTLTEMADILGVTRETLSRYQNRHPELRHIYKQGKGELVKQLKTAAIDTAIKGNPQMQKYLLNNLSDYSEQPPVDMSTHTHFVIKWKEEDAETLQVLQERANPKSVVWQEAEDARGA